ncbi:ubiquitin thioesterase OTU1-like isoform X2 [Teleopsis dalmanni]|nr:ubiquitin thioesterase OTU1-like isoform X2 [Teleopsis dalmanni]
MMMQKTNKYFNKTLREAIADFVISNPEKFDGTFLGSDPESYCKAVIQEIKYGGTIELILLADLFEIEIDILNLHSGTLTALGTGKYVEQRGFLLNNGLYFYPLYILKKHDAKPITLFPVTDKGTYRKAVKLVKRKKLPGSLPFF